MPAEPSVSLILPAYNEARTIRRALDEATAYFRTTSADYEIFVVADGDDGTREIVAELAKQDPHLRVMGSVERRGKGYAVRQAMMAASKDVVGYADADGKTPIDELAQLLPALRDGYDIAIGSRPADRTQVERPQPAYRRAGSRVFHLLMHAAIGLHDITDTQCGFKFFHRDVARDLFSRQRIDGYMFDVEILHLAAK